MGPATEAMSKRLLQPSQASSSWSWLRIQVDSNSSTGAAHCGKVAEEDQHLTMEDLLYALQETRPSVSKGELHKYKRIYEKFSGCQGGQMLLEDAGSRIALA